MENALTLEEAENLMNNRHKAGSRIMQKLKGRPRVDHPLPPHAACDSGIFFLSRTVDLAKDDESMKEEKHMRTGVDSDDEEFAVGFTKGETTLRSLDPGSGSA